jgi:hypothetical protein
VRLIPIRQPTPARGRHKGGTRALQRARGFELTCFLLRLRETLKRDKSELDFKKDFRAQGQDYNLNERTVEKAHELLTQRRQQLVDRYGEGFMDAPITPEDLTDPDPIPLWDPVPSVSALARRLRDAPAKVRVYKRWFPIKI